MTVAQNFNKGEDSDEGNSLFPFYQTITMVEYERLIGKYIKREIDTEEFVGGLRYASCMLEKFPISNELFNVLKILWDAEDNLVADSSLAIPATEDDVTEDQLREIAQNTYFKIKELYFTNKLYEIKYIIIKKLLSKIFWIIFLSCLFTFFCIHAAINFGFLLQSFVFLEGIFQCLNRFVLLCTFFALSGIIGKILIPSSYEMREIKRLFLALILSRPRIEAFENA